MRGPVRHGASRAHLVLEWTSTPTTSPGSPFAVMSRNPFANLSKENSKLLIESKSAP